MMRDRASLVTCLIALVVVIAGAQTPAPPSAQGAEGTWRGTLVTAGGNLRLVLQISKAPDGLLTGHLDSVDQGSRIPIDRITLSGDAVRIDLPVISGTFQGTLNASRTELKGTWTQTAGPLPLIFTRATPETSASPAAAPDAPFSMGLPLDLTVPAPPQPFLGGDGKTYLAYELHITNFSGRDVLLSRLDVASGDTTLASSEGNELNASLSSPGSIVATDRRTIGAGRRVVAFLWLTIDSARPPPSSLRHRLTVGKQTAESTVTVVATPPVTIGPPLGGDNWRAVNGPGPSSGHRRALIAVDGRARIAQRFAIDWVQVNDNGLTYTGDQKDNKSYRCYGADLLAVADATVAAIKDGIPENVPGPQSRAVPITLETVGGNYVILDLGGGRYAFYAHVQPGTLRVKAGDRVKRGQVLGLVGNSGNSTEPHLHFHISDSALPLEAEGLPYAIAGMTGMPMQNARVNFPR